MVQTAFKMMGRALAILALIIISAWLCAYAYGWMSGAENLSLFSLHAGYLYVPGIGLFLLILWICGTIPRPKEAPDEARFALEATIAVCLRTFSNVILASLAAPIACYWLSVSLHALSQHWMATQLFAFRYWSALVVLCCALVWRTWFDNPPRMVRRRVRPNTF